MLNHDCNRILQNTRIFDNWIEKIIEIWRIKKSDFFFNNLICGIKTRDISIKDIVGVLGTYYIRGGISIEEILQSDPKLYEQITAVDSRLSADFGDLLLFRLAKEYSLFSKRNLSKKLTINYRSYLSLVDAYYDIYSICFIANQILMHFLLQSNSEINPYKVLEIWDSKIRPFLKSYTLFTKGIGVGTIILDKIEIEGTEKKYISYDGVFYLDLSDLQSDWIIRVEKKELLGHLDFHYLDKKPKNLSILMAKKQFLDYANSNCVIESKIYNIKSSRSTLRNAFTCWDKQLSTIITKLMNQALPNFFSENSEINIIENIKSKKIESDVLKKILRCHYIIETSYDRVQNTFVDDFLLNYGISEKRTISIEWYRRLGLKLQLLCLSNGGFKPNFVYIDTGVSDNLYLVAKKIRFSNYPSSIDYVSNKLHIQNGFHLSINNNVLEEVLRKKQKLSPDEKVVFAFQCNVNLRKNYKTPRIVVWGVKNENNINCFFSNYNEVLNICKKKEYHLPSDTYLESIDVNFPKLKTNCQNYDLSIKINPYTEKCEITRQKQELDVISPNGNREFKVILSPDCFYNLSEDIDRSLFFLFHEDCPSFCSFYLTLSLKNPSLKNKGLLPKIWINRGLLRSCTIKGFKDPLKSNLRDAKYFFQRFLTTRTVPTLNIGCFDTSEDVEILINLNWVDLNIAIEDLTKLANMIIRYKQDQENSFLSNLVEGLQNFLVTSGALSNLHLDIDILWLKIQDTISYYIDLSETVYLKSFSQTSVEFNSQKEFIIANPFLYVASFFSLNIPPKNTLPKHKEFLQNLYEAYFPLYNLMTINEPITYYSSLYSNEKKLRRNFYAMDAFDFVLAIPLINYFVYSNLSKRRSKKRKFELVNFISGTLTNIDFRTKFIHSIKLILLDEKCLFSFLNDLIKYLEITKSISGGNYESKAEDDFSIFYEIRVERIREALGILKSRILKALNQSPFYKRLLNNDMLKLFLFDEKRGFGKPKIRIAIVPPSIGPYKSTSQKLFSVAGNNVEVNISLLADIEYAIENDLFIKSLTTSKQEIKSITNLLRVNTHFLDRKSCRYKRLTLKKISNTDFYYVVRTLTLLEALYKQTFTIRQRYEIASKNNPSMDIELPNERNVKEKKIRTTLSSAIEIELEKNEENNTFLYYSVKKPIIRPKLNRDLKYIDGKKKRLTTYLSLKQFVPQENLEEELKITIKRYHKATDTENFDLNYFSKVTNNFYMKQLGKKLC